MTSIAAAATSTIPTLTRNFQGIVADDDLSATTTTMPTGGGSPRTRRKRRQVGKHLLGSFEENVLNKRLEPIRTVEGYVAEVRAAGKFHPRPLRSSIPVDFFAAGGSFPYLGQINVGTRGYRIPTKGTLQVTLFNPLGTLVRLFVLIYDLTDMPPNSQTILRQRTVFAPTVAREKSLEHKETKSHTSCDTDGDRFALGHHRVNHLIQISIVSSKSGHTYLSKSLRVLVADKVNLEAASQLMDHNYEFKSIDEMPENPRYFAR